MCGLTRTHQFISLSPLPYQTCAANRRSSWRPSPRRASQSASPPYRRAPARRRWSSQPEPACESPRRTASASEGPALEGPSSSSSEGAAPEGRAGLSSSSSVVDCAGLCVTGPTDDDDDDARFSGRPSGTRPIGSFSRLPSLMPTSSTSAPISCSWLGLASCSAASCFGCSCSGSCAVCTMVSVTGLKKEMRPESVAMTM
mmetsp:Transcript_41283/g.99183  ORF Transcript_41283/g.99183 Transcript_41283/m.99183 type:complete len:200 (+) Transcript_41283:133-732(+)